MKITGLPDNLPEGWENMSGAQRKGHVSKWRRKLAAVDREVRPLEGRASALREFRARILRVVAMMEV